MIDFLDAPGHLPDGQRVYAIGDIHGCADRLWALHAAIAADLAARPVPSPLLLHVGDYVDRGPDSAGVVRRLAAGDPIAGVRTVNLMGNHERTMIDALDGAGASATDWMISGGREALASWGGDPDAPRDTWRGHVPESDMAFLAGLALSHRLGGYLFVHAGIRPGVPLGFQTDQDLLTIRNSFLYSEQDFGVVVVHGHTPRMAPEIRFNRIGIDTGAVFNGKLTCAVLEGNKVGFLQT
jgi:serine/threonine protein phosphatase 1